MQFDPFKPHLIPYSAALPVVRNGDLAQFRSRSLVLMSEPLDPHSVMIRGALCQGSFFKASSPHLRRIPPRTEFSSDSKDCNELQPGFKGSFPVS